MDEDTSYWVIHYGDLVSLFVDDLGYLAIPALSEPVPEIEDAFSHLRAIPSSRSPSSPPDFSLRCVFKILTDRGSAPPNEPVVYGAIVRLVSYATAYNIVASNHPGIVGDKDHHCLYLKRSLKESENFSTHFYVSPRYSMRSEGDPVYTNDRIVLESCTYRGRQISVIQSSISASQYDHVIGLRTDASTSIGIQIGRVGMAESIASNQISTTDLLRGGDFVRLFHQERQGHLICRADDAEERRSLVSPVGMLFRKHNDQPENSHGVFVRNKSTKDSCLTVWQIVSEKPTSFGLLTWGTKVRLLHVASGRYLCIRPPLQEDCYTVKTLSKAIVNSLARSSSIGGLASPSSPRPPRSDSSLALTCSSSDSSGIFEIYSVVENDSETIPMNSFVYFVHSATKFRIELVGSESVLGGPSVGLERTLNPSQSRDAQSFLDSDFVEHKGEAEDSLGPRRRVSSVSAAQKIRLQMASGNQEWWEYLNDLPLRPTARRPEGEVYRLVSVTQHELHDLFYILRFRALLQAATTAVQSAHRFQDISLALYRHVNRAFDSLITWVEGKHDGAAVLSSSASEHQLTSKARRNQKSAVLSDDGLSQDKTPKLKPKAFTSSIVFWAGIQPHLSEEDSAHKFSRQIKTTSRAFEEEHSAKEVFSSTPSRRHELEALTRVVKSRQIALRELNIVEAVVNMTSTIFLLQRNMTSQPIGKVKQTRLHPIIANACILSHDLLLVAAHNNKRVALALISLSGCLLSMIAQLPIGWNPAIETLLVASRANDSSVDGSLDKDWKEMLEVICSLSPADVGSIISQLIQARKDRKTSSLHLLELAATLCAPGKVPDLKIQNLMVRTLIGNKAQGSPPFLFDTRMGSGKQGLWEILTSTTFKMELDPPADVELVSYLKMERHSLEMAFNKYDEDGSNSLEVGELTLLLEDLGLAGPIVYEKAKLLDGCNFATFVHWWRCERNNLYPAASAILRGATANEAARLLGEEEIPDLVPKEMQNIPQDAENKKADQAAGADGKSPEGVVGRFFAKFGGHSSKAEGSNRAQASAGLLLQIKQEKDDLPESDDDMSWGFEDSGPLIPASEPVTNPIEPNTSTAYHGISLQLDRDLASAQSKLDALDDARTQEWQDLSKVLGKNSLEGDWVRASMKFLTEACRGNNIFCQQAVSALMPAELVLWCMNAENTSSKDKALFCTFLGCCYVEHDLVFPAVPLLPTQCIAISVSEEKLPPSQAGKLFNDMSRSIRDDVKHDGSSELRKQLWKFLNNNLLFITLDADKIAAGDDVKFEIALLVLVRSLVVQGFFAESTDMNNAPARSSMEQKLAHSTASSLTGLNLFYRARRGPQQTSTFDQRALEGLLVSKLIASIEKYATKTSGFGADNLDLIEEYFRERFANELAITAKMQVLITLDTLTEIRQLERARIMLVSMLDGKQADKIFPKSILYEGEDTERFVVKLAASHTRQLSSLFAIPQSQQVQFTKALLGTTLHMNSELQTKAYNMLFRWISAQWDFVKQLDAFKIVISPGEARTRRLVHILTILFKKYTTMLQDDSPDYVLHTLLLALDGMRSLCFHSWDSPVHLELTQSRYAYVCGCIFRAGLL